MTSHLGADPYQLDRAAARFETMGSNLLNTCSAIEQRLLDAFWEGPDADRFRADWTGRIRADFRTAAESLGRAAVALRRSATEQRQVSGG